MSDTPPFNVGDTVVLIHCNGWNQPFRKWSEEGRTATVMSCFKPMASRLWKVKVRFDHRRKNITDTFCHDDLVACEAKPVPNA